MKKSKLIVEEKEEFTNHENLVSKNTLTVPDMHMNSD